MGNTVSLSTKLVHKASKEENRKQKQLNIMTCRYQHWD